MSEPGVATAEQSGLSSEERIAVAVAKAQILTLAGAYDKEKIERAFRLISHVVHSDKGGDDTAFRHLKLALNEALADLVEARKQGNRITELLASNEAHAVAERTSIRMALDSPGRERWICVSPHSLAQCLRPSYFAKVKGIRPGDVIELRHTDNKYLAKLYVIEVLKFLDPSERVERDFGAVNFQVLEAYDLTALPVVSYDWQDAVVAFDPARGAWVIQVRGVSSIVNWVLKAAAEKWLEDKQAAARLGKTMQKSATA